jgi:hypothetical protein
MYTGSLGRPHAGAQIMGILNTIEDQKEWWPGDPFDQFEKRVFIKRPASPLGRGMSMTTLLLRSWILSHGQKLLQLTRKAKRKGSEAKMG